MGKEIKMLKDHADRRTNIEVCFRIGNSMSSNQILSVGNLITGQHSFRYRKTDYNRSLLYLKEHLQYSRHPYVSFQL